MTTIGGSLTRVLADTHLTNNQTLIIIALIGVFGTLATSGVSAWNSRQTKKQMRPNGGTSFRDAINRIETRLTALEDYITNPKEKL